MLHLRTASRVTPAPSRTLVMFSMAARYEDLPVSRTSFRNCSSTHSLSLDTPFDELGVTVDPDAS